MTRDEANAAAREVLERLVARHEPGGNRDWDQLVEAARWALAGDERGIAVCRRVFEQPGFCTSNSGMEVGYAALGLALLGDVASLETLRRESMPFNGIDDNLAIARVLLGDRAPAARSL